MSTASKTRLPQTLRRAIDGYRRRWRAITAEHGLCVTLCVFVGAVGAAVVADRLFRLSPALRAVALGTVAVASVVCLARWVLWPALRRMRDRQAAARLGHHFPQVEEDLVSAVELSSENAREQGVSQGLVESALEQISHRAQGVDHRAALPVRPVLKVAGVFAAIVALFATAFVLRHDAVRNALVRLFAPGSGEAYFCYTKLRVEPGDQVIAQGEPLEIEIATSGHCPAFARLEIQGGRSALRERVELDDGTATWTSKSGLHDDRTYRVRAGDAVSETYQVRVVPAPALASKSLRVVAPAYADAQERTIRKLHRPVSVVAGSTITLSAVPADREPIDDEDEEKFVCQGVVEVEGQRFAMTSQDGGVLTSPPMTPPLGSKRGDTYEVRTYGISLTDGYGLASRKPETVAVRVVPDRVPSVEIARPRHDGRILLGQQARVRAQARDEFGIRALSLRYRILKAASGYEPGRWKRVALAPGGTTQDTLEGQAFLPPDPTELAEDDRLELQAEAADYAGTAFKRTGRSEIRTLTAISKARHVEEQLARLSSIRDGLRDEAADQKAEADGAGKLAKDAATKSVAKEAREAKEREHGNMRDARDIKREAEEVMKELAGNDETPGHVLPQMKRLADGIESVAGGDMRDAAEKFGEAAKAQQAQKGQKGQKGQEGQEGDKNQEGQEGQQNQQGQEGQQGQKSPLRMAKSSAEQAERELEQLAQLAERIRRRSKLEKLAHDAEVLAALQRELKDVMVPIAIKTVGTSPEDMTKLQKRQVKGFEGRQKSIQGGIETLDKDIRKIEAELSNENSSDAPIAEAARVKLSDDKVIARAGEIAAQLARNVVFSQIREQEGVATSLDAVATILRRAPAYDELEAIAKEIEEFIRRQTEINTHISAKIKDAEALPSRSEIAGKQNGLQRDVSEQASALHWLARQMAGFDSATADKLDAAAGEMGLVIVELDKPDYPEALKHGERALALLKDAREEFDAERQQMQQASEQAMDFEALYLLHRVLLGQKRIKRGTGHADKVRFLDPDRFSRLALGLTTKQSRVHLDTRKLRKLLARYRRIAQRVGQAGGMMKVSRLALSAGDTGTKTREVQAAAIVLLESLIQEAQSAMGGGMAGAMSMMGSMLGSTPGGYDGGTNDPTRGPAPVDQAADEAWRKVRDHFGERLGAGSEAKLPAHLERKGREYFKRLQEGTR